MKSIEKIGKTVDEAVSAALKELGLSREEVDIKVLEEPSKGLLGLIGAKPAKVKVTEKERSIDRVRVFLENVLEKMQLEAQVAVTGSEDMIKADIQGEGIGVIIGKRGQTLDSLQYLTNIVANKAQEKRVRVLVDAEGYRKRREEVLHSLAIRLADKVRRSGQNVMLEPMNAQERKIIHSALQDNHYVTTKSEGEEPFRKIVIMPRK